MHNSVEKIVSLVLNVLIIQHQTFRAELQPLPPQLGCTCALDVQSFCFQQFNDAVLIVLCPPPDYAIDFLLSIDSVLKQLRVEKLESVVAAAVAPGEQMQNDYLFRSGSILLSYLNIGMFLLNSLEKSLNAVRLLHALTPHFEFNFFLAVSDLPWCRSTVAFQNAIVF